MRKEIFENTDGDFSAYYQACARANELGYSVGSMCRRDPIGLMKGDYKIAKWKNLTDEEKNELDGILTAPSFRNGPVTLSTHEKEKEIMKPRRIQRKRTKGWKMPPNTVSVTRPGKFGNPFKWVDGWIMYFHEGEWKKWSLTDSFSSDPYHVYKLYKMLLKGQLKDNPAGRPLPAIPDNIESLRGKNLACFCPVGQQCHADILIEVANS